MKLQKVDQNEKSTATLLHMQTLLRIGVWVVASVALISVLFPVSHSSLAPTALLLEKAQASSAWPVPSPSLSVSLKFRDSYEFQNKVYTHCGIDIASDAGSQVCSPVNGTISFIGNVPASDSAVTSCADGETMRAISVALSDGRSVTLMPIQDESVSKGQSVSEGQVLATLAATGDRSSSFSHLHMGLKRGSVYYDPLTLFGMSSSSQDGATQNEESVSTQGATAQGDAALEQNSAQLNSEGAKVFAGDIGQPDTVLQPQTQPQDSYGSITSGQPVTDGLQNKADNTVSPLSCLASIFSPVADACMGQMQALYGAFCQLSEISGLPVLVFAIGSAVLIVALISAACYCFIRFILPQLRKRCGFSKIKSCTKESEVVG